MIDGFITQPTFRPDGRLDTLHKGDAEKKQTVVGGLMDMKHHDDEAARKRAYAKAGIAFRPNALAGKFTPYSKPVSAPAASRSSTIAPEGPRRSGSLLM